MGAFPPPDWYARLARALEAEDAEQARAQAHALLTEIRDEDARLRERLQMLSSASFEGIMVHVDGVVIDANQRLCEMLGYELRGGARPAHDSALRGARRPARRAGAHVQSLRGRIRHHRRAQGRLALPRRAAVQAGPDRATARCASPPSATSPSASARWQLLRESERRFRDLARAAFDFTVFSRDGIIVEVDGDARVGAGRRTRRDAGPRGPGLHRALVAAAGATAHSR